MAGKRLVLAGVYPVDESLFFENNVRAERHSREPLRVRPVVSQQSIMPTRPVINAGIHVQADVAPSTLVQRNADPEA